MKSNNRNNGIRFRSRWALIALACAPVAGCSGLVDSPQTKAPETNVKNYYIQLDHPKMQYRYTLGSQNAYLPASDVLVMDMQGMVTDDSLGRTPIYSCNWSYQTAAGGAPWFYAMDESQAVALGVEYNSKYTDSWVELKTPLAQDKSWTFVSKGETVKATVAKYGSSAQVSGNTYDDVVVVNYQGTNGTTGTEWFARGVGTIYYHVVRPNNVLIIEQFQSMAQK